MSMCIHGDAWERGTSLFPPPSSSTHCQCPPPLAACPLPVHAPYPSPAPSPFPSPFHVRAHATPICANGEHGAVHIRYAPLLTLTTAPAHVNRQQEVSPPLWPQAPIYA